MGAIPDPEDQPTLTVDHVAELLGIGRSTAYAAIKLGKIPSIRVGRRILIPTAAFRQWIDPLEDPPARR